jgi:hypothetical protein
VSRLTGRHAVLLSAAARREDSTLDLRVPQCVEEPAL